MKTLSALLVLCEGNLSQVTKGLRYGPFIFMLTRINCLKTVEWTPREHVTSLHSIILTRCNTLWLLMYCEIRSVCTQFSDCVSENIYDMYILINVTCKSHVMYWRIMFYWCAKLGVKRYFWKRETSDMFKLRSYLQVPPLLSCGDTYQMWGWCPIGNRCFANLVKHGE